MASDDRVLVRLFRNNHPVAYCTPKYIGVLGVKLDIGPISYQKGTVVELELTLSKEEESLKCMVPGVVTSHSADGLGVTFLDHSMATNSRLLEIVMAYKRIGAAKQ